MIEYSEVISCPERHCPCCGSKGRVYAEDDPYDPVCGTEYKCRNCDSEWMVTFDSGLADEMDKEAARMDQMGLGFL